MVTYNSSKYQIKKYKKADWDKYEKIELAWFAQDARDCHTNICKELNFITLRDSKDILKRLKELRTEAARAQTVLDDWKTFNQHLEKNPTIKEGWEALLMAIRLTEEDED